MIKISAVVSAFNEEAKIAECLQSLSFCDEIILVDNESSDQTSQVARKNGAQVFIQPNKQMLNINKNFGFSKAKNDWILNLDADEAVSDELKAEVERLTDSLGTVAYKIPRKNIIFGKWIRHSLWWPDYQIRLFKKNNGEFSCQHIHELLKVDGEVGVLKGYLLHHNYESVSQFLQKLDKIYSVNEVEYLLSQKKQLHWNDALWLPANDFFKTYFLQKGYRDGLHGLVLSLLQSFYSLVVFAKYWEKNKFAIKEPEDFPRAFILEVKKITKDFNYWLRTLALDESKSKVEKIIIKTKRKIGI